MDKPTYNVVSFSGGKDSTAMLLRLLEENRPVDEILFCDTGMEFPAMYSHLDQLEQYIGRPITRTKADYSFAYYFAQVPIKRGNLEGFVEKYGRNYTGNSWPGPRMRWCTSLLKDAPRERHLRTLRENYEVYQYVGIAADEEYRLQRKNNQREDTFHPLVEWGMTEADCLKYCYDHGFDWDGLYEIFHRVSCWCCPLQSLSELRKLHDYFPELWSQMREWDDMTFRKFRADYSVRELEIRFDFEKECLAKGLPIRGKAFFDGLKQRLEAMPK